MDKVYQDSLDLHRKHGGKLEIASKVPLAQLTNAEILPAPWKTPCKKPIFSSE